MLGQAVARYSGADGDGDGLVDNDDYAVWTAHFGQTAGSGSGGNANAAIPEPASLWLLLLAGMLSMCSFRRAVVS
jgi:hypothetical protein